MNPLKELEAMEEPILARACEAIQIISVKTTWAAHEVVSYGGTHDAQDLVEAERLLIEMRDEIAAALQSIQKEIHREDERISAEAAAEARQGNEE
jgi:hypothetical protein